MRRRANSSVLKSILRAPQVPRTYLSREGRRRRARTEVAQGKAEEIPNSICSQQFRLEVTNSQAELLQQLAYL